MAHGSVKSAIWFVVAALLTGCTAPPPEPSPLEGIKLSDLRPADAPAKGLVMPPSVNLKVLVFSIPEGHYEKAARGVLSLLDTGPGILRSAADCQANGFVAGTGRIAKMDAINKCLKNADATLVTSNFYTVCDDKGDDIEMVGLTQAVTVQYWNNGSAENKVLKPGYLAIRMTVKRFASRASVFRMLIQPVWKPHHEATLIERTTGVSRNIIFETAGIDTNMQVGDIAVLAASPVLPEGTSLAGITMGGRRGGNMKMVIVLCTGMSR